MRSCLTAVREQDIMAIILHPYTLLHKLMPTLFLTLLHTLLQDIVAINQHPYADKGCLLNDDVANLAKVTIHHTNSPARCVVGPHSTSPADPGMPDCIDCVLVLTVLRVLTLMPEAEQWQMFVNSAHFARWGPGTCQETHKTSGCMQ